MASLNWTFSKIITIFFLGSLSVKTSGQTVADIMDTFGCFTAQDIVILGELAPPKTDYTDHNAKSCKEACLNSPNCTIWSIDPGPTVSYKQPFMPTKIPQIHAHDPIDKPLPEWPSTGPKCYLLNGSTPVTNITMKYAYQGVLETRTCFPGSVGCFERIPNISVSDVNNVQMLNGADTGLCMGGCSRRNFTYFGLANRSECYCGNTFGAGIRKNDTVCHPCPVGTGAYCWDANHIQVFTTGVREFDDMCVLGKASLSLEGATPVVNTGSSVLQCRQACRKLENTGCVMWSYNSSHCTFLYRYHLNGSYKIKLDSGEKSFFGLASCNQPADLIYFASVNAPVLRVEPANTQWNATGQIADSHSFSSWRKAVNKAANQHTLGEIGWGSTAEPAHYDFYVGRDESGDALALPTSFEQDWSQSNQTTIWSAQCPNSYSSLGDLTTAGHQQQKYFANHRCVSNDLVNIVSSSRQIWSKDLGNQHAVVWESGQSEPNEPEFHFYKFSKHPVQAPSSHPALPALKGGINISSEYYIYAKHLASFQTKRVRPDDLIRILYVPGKKTARDVKYFNISFAYASDEQLRSGWMMTGHEMFKQIKIRLVKKEKGWAVANPTSFDKVAVLPGYLAKPLIESNEATYYIWRMVCPPNFVTLGDVATNRSQPPDRSKYACVHKNFVATIGTNKIREITGILLETVKRRCYMDRTEFFFIGQNGTSPPKRTFRLKQHKDERFSSKWCHSAYRKSSRTWNAGVATYRVQLAERMERIRSAEASRKENAEHETDYGDYSGGSYGAMYVLSGVAGSDSQSVVGGSSQTSSKGSSAQTGLGGSSMDISVGADSVHVGIGDSLSQDGNSESSVRTGFGGSLMSSSVGDSSARTGHGGSSSQEINRGSSVRTESGDSLLQNGVGDAFAQAGTGGSSSQDRSNKSSTRTQFGSSSLQMGVGKNSQSMVPVRGGAESKIDANTATAPATKIYPTMLGPVVAADARADESSNSDSTAAATAAQRQIATPTQGRRTTIRKTSHSEINLAQTGTRPAHAHRQNPTSPVQMQKPKSSSHANEEANMIRLILPQTFGEAIKGWGCYRTRPDIALVATDVQPGFVSSLRHHCSSHCTASERCVAWSFIPEVLKPTRPARCFYTYTNTSIHEVSVAHIPGATTGFKNCDSGYVGCFEDQDKRDLARNVQARNAQLSTCLKKCQSYTYAGLQNHRECWCGNGFGLYNQSTTNGSECNHACEVNPQDNCGGHFKNSIYRTGKSINDKMCVLGRFSLNRYLSSDEEVFEASQVRNCAFKCELRKLGCHMWSYNGTHCALISKSRLKSAEQLSPDISISPYTYTGFAECKSQHGGPHVIYQHSHRNADGKLNRKAFMESGSFSFDPAVSRAQTKRDGTEEVLSTWRVQSSHIEDNWRTLGDMYARPGVSRGRSSRVTAKLLRPIEGGGLIQPTNVTLLTSDGLNNYWRLECPPGYHALGDLVTNISATPNIDQHACVHQIFLVRAKYGNTVWSVPRSDWEMQMIEPSECPGKNLSMFTLVQQSTVPGRVYTLRNPRGLNISCPEPVTTTSNIPLPSTYPTTNEPTTAEPTTTEPTTTEPTTKEPTTTEPTTTEPTTTEPTTTETITTEPTTTEAITTNPVTTEPATTPQMIAMKLTAGEAIAGWNCKQHRDFILKGHLVNATRLDGLVYKDICEEMCLRGDHCVAWSYVPHTMGTSRERLLAQCYHVLENDLISRVSVLWIPHAFVGFKTCSTEYIGCFSDQLYLRDLEETGIERQATVETCRNACSKKEMAYFGLQFRQECWCGNVFGSYNWVKRDDECSMRCLANSSQICGNQFKNTIYRTGDSRNDELCIIAQATLDSSVVRLADVFPEESVVNCRDRCLSSCAVWSHNSTHCFIIDKDNWASGQGSAMQPHARSFVGLAQCNQRPREHLEHSNVSMSMEIKIVADEPLHMARVVAKDGNGSQLLFPVPQSVPGYYNLGHVALLNVSGARSPGTAVAKPLSGEPLVPVDDVYEIYTRSVEPGSNKQPLYFYHLECPSNYSSLGNIASFSTEAPDQDSFRCVNDQFLKKVKLEENLMMETDWRLHEVSLWRTEPVDSNDFSFKFFKAAEHFKKPEEDHLHLRTLPKKLPEMDGSYRYDISILSELEIEKDATPINIFQGFYRAADDDSIVKAIGIYGGADKGDGWFQLGQVASANTTYNGPISAARNIQGAALSRPIGVEYISSATAFQSIKEAQNNSAAFWKIKCENDYHFLGDVATLNGERPNLDKLSCVHRSHLSRAQAGGILWEHNTGNETLQLVRVEPTDCDDGQQMKLFTASRPKDVARRQYYVLKKDPNIKYGCELSKTYPMKIVGARIVKELPLPASELSKAFVGFQRNVLLSGDQMMNITDIVHCKDECKDHCISYSFLPNFANANHSKCYHVTRDMLLRDVRLSHAPGAFTYIKSATNASANTLLPSCSFLPVSLAIRDTSPPEISASNSASSCSQICRSDSCALWSFNNTHCLKYPPTSLSNAGISLDVRSGGVTGFSECLDDSDIFWADDRAELQIKLVQDNSQPSFDGRTIPSRFTALDDDNDDEDYFILGHVVVKGAVSANNVTNVLARSTRGSSLLPPVRLTLADSSPGNSGSLWNMVCPPGSKSLGTVASTTSSMPDMSRLRCVADRFLTNASYGEVLWASDAGSVREIKPVNDDGFDFRFFKSGTSFPDDSDVYTLPRIPPGRGSTFTYRDGSAMVMESRLNRATAANSQKLHLEVVEGKRRFDIWRPAALSDGWTTVGEVFDNGKMFDGNHRTLRNIYGKGVVPPVGSEKVGTVQGYRSHHDAHEKNLSNLTLHRPQCPTNYHALSDFGNMDNGPVFDHGSVGCVHRYFVADGELGNTVFAEKDVSRYGEHTLNITEIDGENGSGQSSRFYSTVKSDFKTPQRVYVLRPHQDEVISSSVVSEISPTFDYQYEFVDLIGNDAPLMPEVIELSSTTTSTEDITTSPSTAAPPTTTTAATTASYMTTTVTTTTQPTTTTTPPTTITTQPTTTTTQLKTTTTQEETSTAMEQTNSSPSSSCGQEADPGELFTSKRATAVMELKGNWKWNNTFRWNGFDKEVSAWEPVGDSDDYYVIGQTPVTSRNTEPPAHRAVMARPISGNPLAPPSMIAPYWSIGDHLKTDRNNGSLWHVECPPGFASLGDMAAPSPAHPSHRQSRFRCVSKDFVEPAKPDRLLWSVDSADSGTAAMWSLTSSSDREKSPDYEFFRASDHISKPENESLYVLRAPDFENESSLVYENAPGFSFYLKKVSTMKKKAEVVVPSFTDITYSFWQPVPPDGYNVLGQVYTAQRSFSGHSYVIRNADNFGATAMPVSAIKLSDENNSKQSAFWRIVCPESYHALSHFALPRGEVPDLANIACVHEDFLTVVLKRVPSFSVSKIDIRKITPPTNCDAIKFNFFTATHGSDDELIYSIKNGTAFDKCAGDFVHEYDIAGNVRDASWLGCFSKRNVLLMGRGVTAVNAVGEPELMKCKATCQLNEDCFAWSFSPWNVSAAEHHCFHVYKEDSLDDLELMSSPGALAQTKSCTLSKLGNTLLGCYEDTGFRDFNYVAMENSSNIGLCIDTCAQQRYPYAAMQEDSCRCGKTFGGSGPSESSRCSYKCQSQRKGTCGGPAAFTVHTTGKKGLDDVMCILGRVNIVLEEDEELQLQGNSSLKDCREACAAKSRADCWLWTHNAASCRHIPASVFSISPKSYSIKRRLDDSYVGFPECEENPGLIYEALNHKSAFIATYQQAGEVKLSMVTSMYGDYKQEAFETYVPESQDKNGTSYILGEIGKLGSSAIDQPVLSVSSSSSGRNLVVPAFEQIWPIDADSDENEPYEAWRLWKMICPENYHSLGDVSGESRNEPTEAYRCVHKELVQEAQIGTMLWSYQDKFGLGNVSLWSVESRNPDQASSAMTYFIASASLSKPNRTVYELTSQLDGDIKSKLRKREYVEDLRFETRRSIDDQHLLTLDRSDESLTEALSEAQTLEAIASNATGWLSFLQPTDAKHDWKILGQQLQTAKGRKNLGTRIARNIEGPALLPGLSLDTYAIFAASNSTTDKSVEYAVQRIRCPPDHRSLGDIINLYQDETETTNDATSDDLQEPLPYGCVHRTFLTKAELGSEVWRFTSNAFQTNPDNKNSIRKSVKSLSIYEVLPADAEGENMEFFTSIINDDVASLKDLYTLKKHPDGSYPVFLGAGPPIIIGGNTHTDDTSANSQNALGDNNESIGVANAQEKCDPKSKTGFMVAFIIVLILLIIVTAYLIYKCCRCCKACFRGEPANKRDDLEARSQQSEQHNNYNAKGAAAAAPSMHRASLETKVIVMSTQELAPGRFEASTKHAAHAQTSGNDTVSADASIVNRWTVGFSSTKKQSKSQQQGSKTPIYVASVVQPQSSHSTASFATVSAQTASSQPMPCKSQLFQDETLITSSVSVLPGNTKSCAEKHVQTPYAGNLGFTLSHLDCRSDTQLNISQHAVKSQTVKYSAETQRYLAATRTGSWSDLLYSSNRDSGTSSVNATTRLLHEHQSAAQNATFSAKSLKYFEFQCSRDKKNTAGNLSTKVFQHHSSFAAGENSFPGRTGKISFQQEHRHRLEYGTSRTDERKFLLSPQTNLSLGHDGASYDYSGRAASGNLTDLATYNNSASLSSSEKKIQLVSQASNVSHFNDTQSHSTESILGMNPPVSAAGKGATKAEASAQLSHSCDTSTQAIPIVSSSQLSSEKENKQSTDFDSFRIKICKSSSGGDSVRQVTQSAHNSRTNSYEPQENVAQDEWRQVMNDKSTTFADEDMSLPQRWDSDPKSRAADMKDWKYAPHSETSYEYNSTDEFVNGLETVHKDGKAAVMTKKMTVITQSGSGQPQRRGSPISHVNSNHSVETATGRQEVDNLVGNKEETVPLAVEQSSSYLLPTDTTEISNIFAGFTKLQQAQDLRKHDAENPGQVATYPEDAATFKSNLDKIDRNDMDHYGTPGEAHVVNSPIQNFWQAGAPCGIQKPVARFLQRNGNTVHDASQDDLESSTAVFIVGDSQQSYFPKSSNASTHETNTEGQDRINETNRSTNFDHDASTRIDNNMTDKGSVIISSTLLVADSSLDSESSPWKLETTEEGKSQEFLMDTNNENLVHTDQAHSFSAFKKDFESKSAKTHAVIINSATGQGLEDATLFVAGKNEKWSERELDYDLRAMKLDEKERSDGTFTLRESEQQDVWYEFDSCSPVESKASSTVCEAASLVDDEIVGADAAKYISYVKHVHQKTKPHKVDEDDFSTSSVAARYIDAVEHHHTHSLDPTLPRMSSTKGNKTLNDTPESFTSDTKLSMHTKPADSSMRSSVFAAHKHLALKSDNDFITHASSSHSDKGIIEHETSFESPASASTREQSAAHTLPAFGAGIHSLETSEENEHNTGVEIRYTVSHGENIAVGTTVSPERGFKVEKETLLEHVDDSDLSESSSNAQNKRVNRFFHHHHQHRHSHEQSSHKTARNKHDELEKVSTHSSEANLQVNKEHVQDNRLDLKNQTGSNGTELSKSETTKATFVTALFKKFKSIRFKPRHGKHATNQTKTEQNVLSFEKAVKPGIPFKVSLPEPEKHSEQMTSSAEHINTTEYIKKRSSTTGEQNEETVPLQISAQANTTVDGIPNSVSDENMRDGQHVACVFQADDEPGKQTSHGASFAINRSGKRKVTSEQEAEKIICERSLANTSIKQSEEQSLVKLAPKVAPSKCAVVGRDVERRIIVTASSQDEDSVCAVSASETHSTGDKVTTANLFNQSEAEPSKSYDVEVLEQINENKTIDKGVFMDKSHFFQSTSLHDIEVEEYAYSLTQTTLAANASGLSAPRTTPEVEFPTNQNLEYDFFIHNDSLNLTTAKTSEKELSAQSEDNLQTEYANGEEDRTALATTKDVEKDSVVSATTNTLEPKTTVLAKLQQNGSGSAENNKVTVVSTKYHNQHPIFLHTFECCDTNGQKKKEATSVLRRVSFKTMLRRTVASAIELAKDKQRPKLNPALDSETESETDESVRSTIISELIFKYTPQIFLTRGQEESHDQTGVIDKAIFDAQEHNLQRAMSCSAQSDAKIQRTRSLERLGSIDLPVLYVLNKFSPSPRASVEYERWWVARKTTPVLFHRSTIKETLPRQRYVIAVLSDQEGGHKNVTKTNAVDSLNTPLSSH